MQYFQRKNVGMTFCRTYRSRYPLSVSLIGCQLSQRESQESAGEGIGRVDKQHALVDHFAAEVERNVTSWAPPSTMEVAETSVSLASFCRSGMVMTPQLHIVDLTL